jgi:hypothetical protein
MNHEPGQSLHVYPTHQSRVLAARSARAGANLTRAVKAFRDIFLARSLKLLFGGGKLGENNCLAVLRPPRCFPPSSSSGLCKFDGET